MPRTPCVSISLTYIHPLRRRVLSWCSYIILLAFLVNTLGPIPVSQAQEFRLPAPGLMVRLSPPLDPPILKGIKVYPNDPFRFEFILDKGDSSVIPAKAGIQNQEELKQEATKLIKYFLASLTIPEKDLWVNLSPYEKDRIIPQSFGLTEMGRDLLAEDYMLKQITASLIYPEDAIGKKFWKRIYQEAAQKYGTTNIPVNTFNKVWIIPQKAVVYENAKAGTAYVVESKLKVMLEQDYLSLQKHSNTIIPSPSEGRVREGGQEINALGSQVVREIVIPELTREVNENKNFARLRQVYNSLILATWYKQKIKDSILAQVYADKNKVAGVNIDDLKEKEKIYQQYLRAFKKGVYNYIKEDTDPLTQETVPRKYFSGGEDLALLTTHLGTKGVFETTTNKAMFSPRDFLKTTLLAVTAKILNIPSKVLGQSTAARSILFGYKKAIPVDPAMADFAKFFASIMGKQTKASSSAASGIDVNRLNAILAENGKVNEIRWNNEGERLFQDLFSRHMRDRHSHIVRGALGSFSSLTGLWSGLQGVRPEDAFSYISQWVMARIRELSVPGREAELFELTVDVTRFVHWVLIAELRSTLTYRKDRPSMVSLLNNDGWNCRAISDLTAVLMGLWGSRSVSFVEVVENPDGKQYPLADGTRHAANLVKVGTRVAYVDQGAPAEYNKGRIKVFRNQREEVVSMVALKGSLYADAQGLTIDRIYEHLKAMNEYASILDRLGQIPGIKTSRVSGRYEINILLTSDNVKGMHERLAQYIGAMEELSRRIVDMRTDPIPVAVLDPNLQKVLASNLKLLREFFQKANQRVQEIQAAENGDSVYTKFVEKCKTLGLLVVNGHQVGYQVTNVNSSIYISQVPGLLAELNGYAHIPDATFQTNRQMLVQLLSKALETARVQQSTTSILDGLLQKCQQMRLITVQGTRYSSQLSNDTASIYIREIPVIMPELDAVIRNTQLGQQLRTNVQGLKDLLSRSYEGARIIDQLNRFVDNYNLNRGNPTAMSRLQNEIRAFVGMNRATIISAKFMDGFLRIYHAAGGRGDLALISVVGQRETGGIDLTPANMNVQIQNAGEEIKFHLDPALLAQLQNATGFTPLIINIQPMTNLNKFLGLQENSSPTTA